jgi:hypothetical protein
MRIKYPTAFYSSVIPSKPQQAGNVTFTISSTEPPRPKSASIKIPEGLAPKIPRKVISRSNFGELVYTISNANKSVLNNATKPFFVGDVLEFNQTATVLPVTNAPTSLLEIRHDLNRIDYSALGLSAEEVELLNKESDNAQSELRTNLAAKQKLYDDIISSISNLQIVINETRKAITATNIIYEQSKSEGIKEIIVKLELKLTETNSQIDALTKQSASVSAEVNALVDQSRNIGVIVI